MKKRIKWITALLLCMAAGAIAHEETPLPQAVKDLCESVHPGYEVAVHDGWGSDKGGQFALVLSKDGDNILCMAEKAQDDAAYRLTIDNTNAVYDGDDIPSVMIDTGGDSLFYGYDDGIDAVHIHTEKQNGQWQAVDVTAYENLNGGYRSVQSGLEEGYLYYDEDREDENGNILHGFSYAPILVGAAFETAMEPQNFDINLYDADPVYGLFKTSQMPGMAEKWLSDGERLIAVDLKCDHVIMLLEQANGNKRLRIASLEDGLYRIRETGELPSDTGMDAFHTGEDALILTRGGGTTLIGFELELNGDWRIRYLQSGDGMTILHDGVRSMAADGAKRNDGVVYGEHPWQELFGLDVSALPQTFEQAAAKLDQSGYALVCNPNPADRLHLRVRPDKSAASLGKFYNRTPVYVLERGKTWTKVRIGNEEDGLTGYMMTKYLVFEEREKAELVCAFPQKHLIEGYADIGVTMYQQPRKDAMANNLFEYQYGDYIIGVSGDAWFVVMRANGAVGYVPQAMFWDGNG